MIKDGVHFDLSMDDYLRHDYIQSSRLKLLHEGTPKDYLAGSNFKGSRSTQLGTAIHLAILEPEKFPEMVALQPEDWGSLSKNPGRVKWNEFKLANRQKMVFKWDEAKFIKKLIAEYEDDFDLRAIVGDSKVEVSGFVSDDGVGLKARPDIIQSDGTLWDIKTTAKVPDQRNIYYLIKNNGYDFQIAHHSYVMQQLGVEIKRVGWIFITTQTPAIHIVIRQASDDMFGVAREEYQTTLARLKDCIKKDYWPGHEATNFEPIESMRPL